MAQCAVCAKSILLGGETVGPRRFCSEGCRDSFILAPHLAALNETEVADEARRRWSAPCPVCAREGPNDAFVVRHVFSLVQISVMSQRVEVGCQGCRRKVLLKSTLSTFLIGWWSLTGLVATPIALVSNLRALFLNFGAQRPSAELIAFTRVRMALARITPAVPRPRPARTAQQVAADSTAVRRAQRIVVRAAAALTVVAACFVAGASWWMGRHARVYLVSGRAEPYVATVGATRLMLQPARPLLLELPEGRTEVGVPGAAPSPCELERSFFGRLFGHEVFVINPDGAAVVAHEWNAYMAAGDPQTPSIPEDEVSTGLCARYSRVDYFFEPFPEQLPVYRNAVVLKSRLALRPR